MTGTKPNLIVEIGLLILLAVLWGSSYPLIKIALETIPPVTLIAVRVTLAAMFLIVILAWRGESLPKTGNTWRMLFVQAIFNSIGAWTILAWGQQFVDSGLASVLNSTSPVFVFFLTLLIPRHESTSTLKLLGACLGVAGVTLIVGVDVLEGLGRQVVAQLAVLFGAVLYAGAAIYGKRFSHLPPVVTAAGTMIWGTVCLVPLSMILEQPWTLRPSWDSLSAALVLAVFCTGGALLIYFRILRTLGSMGAASQSYLRTVVGVLIGVFLLGERMTPMIGFGVALAVLGVAAINAPSLWLKAILRPYQGKRRKVSG